MSTICGIQKKGKVRAYSIFSYPTISLPIEDAEMSVMVFVVFNLNCKITSTPDSSSESNLETN